MNQFKYQRALTRLTIAVRIRKAVWPVLSDPSLFTCQRACHGLFWRGASFHVASVQAPSFTSFEVWPIFDEAGLSKRPIADEKGLNLHRSAYGEYDLVSYRNRGEWEENLLRYVGAPLGLLTLQAC